MGQSVNYIGDQKFWFDSFPLEIISVNNTRPGTQKYWFNGVPVGQIQRKRKKKKFVTVSG